MAEPVDRAVDISAVCAEQNGYLPDTCFAGDQPDDLGGLDLRISADQRGTGEGCG